MFVPKLAALYGVLLIAATDAFPGMIPNHARQDAPISDTQPIRLSSVNEGPTSSLLVHTVPPSLAVDPPTSTASNSLLSAPTTTVQPDNASGSATMSTLGIPTATGGATGTVHTPETATESLGTVTHMSPRRPFMTA